MSDTWAPADVNMQDYWAEVIGGEYKPVKHGKHASTHPRTVKAVLDGVRGSEIADVIVGMIFWQTIARNREQMAWERVRELEAEIAALRRERDDALLAADIVKDLATPPISDADVERMIAEAKRVRQDIEGERT